jgi:hypothetical protein
MKNNLISLSNISGVMGILGVMYSVIFGRSNIESLLINSEKKEILVPIIYYFSLVLVMLFFLIPVIIKLIIPFCKMIRIGKEYRKLGIDYVKFMSFSRKGSGDRTNEYQKLRKKAQHSVFIMGIGLTNVSKETESFAEQIKGIHKIKYRILMQSPQLLYQKSDKHENFVKLFGENYFSKYFSRTGYESEINASYQRLIEFYKRMNKEYGKAIIEMKEISKGFFPINMTAIDDENENGEMLFDFCFPLSTERLIFKLSKRNNCELFNECIKICNEIFEKYSEDVLEIHFDDDKKMT